MGPINLEETRQLLLPLMSSWSSASGISVENDKQSSPLATLGCSHEKLAAAGSWRKRTLSPPLYMLSNTCWNGGVHPALHCFAKKNPHFLFCCANSDSCFHRGANNLWLRVCLISALGMLYGKLREYFTCVFVFVSEQRAALLEDLVAQITGVRAAVRLLRLLLLRPGVGVTLLLDSREAL